MRRIAHGIAHFDPATEAELDHLLLLFNSAKRSAYQAYRHYKTNNWHIAYHAIKPDYPELSGAWIQAACGEAKRYHDQPNVIFGGQKLWNEVAFGKSTREQWIKARNNQLYGSGDVGNNGNRFIRIEADRILINRPDVVSGKNKWMVGK